MTGPSRPTGAAAGEGTFDRALGGAARALIVEPMPADVLAAPRPAAARSRLAFAAPGAVAVAIVVFAIGSAVGGPRQTRPGPVPIFRTGDAVAAELGAAGYGCRAGAPAATAGGPRMEAIVCTTSSPALAATVIVSEDPPGRVGEIHVSVTFPAAPDATADRDRPEALQELIGMPFADPADAAAARAWLAGVLPIDPGKEVAATVARTPVALGRSTRDGYVIVLGDLRGGSSPGPSAGPPASSPVSSPGLPAARPG